MSFRFPPGGAGGTRAARERGAEDADWFDGARRQVRREKGCTRTSQRVLVASITNQVVRRGGGCCALKCMRCLVFGGKAEQRGGRFLGDVCALRLVIATRHDQWRAKERPSRDRCACVAGFGGARAAAAAAAAAAGGVTRCTAHASSGRKKHLAGAFEIHHSRSASLHAACSLAGPSALVGAKLRASRQTRKRCFSLTQNTQLARRTTSTRLKNNASLFRAPNKRQAHN